MSLIVHDPTQIAQVAREIQMSQQQLRTAMHDIAGWAAVEDSNSEYAWKVVSRSLIRCLAGSPVGEIPGPPMCIIAALTYLQIGAACNLQHRPEHQGHLPKDDLHSLYAGF